MKVHYLEIVAADRDAVCAAYEAAHGVTFGPADPMLGGARTTALPHGGILGVRGPLRDSEEPIVRPYWLVDDIQSALAAATKTGAFVAHPPLEIPGKGTFAIYIQGGVNHGLWQL
jgi:predicted enzyme related to lactoylglutathione lyase